MEGLSSNEKWNQVMNADAWEAEDQQNPRPDNNLKRVMKDEEQTILNEYKDMQIT